MASNNSDDARYSMGSKIVMKGNDMGFGFAGKVALVTTTSKGLGERRCFGSRGNTYRGLPRAVEKYLNN